MATRKKRLKMELIEARKSIHAANQTATTIINKLVDVNETVETTADIIEETNTTVIVPAEKKTTSKRKTGRTTGTGRAKTAKKITEGK